MPTYERAPSEVKALIADRIQSGHYPDLAEAQATVSAWFAFALDDAIPVKVNGQRRGAHIKVNSAKDRLEGKADASMTIDGRAWKDEWSEDEKAAEIDHQLARLVVVRSKPTKANPVSYILSDDNGRPKLKTRPYDYQIGYFVAVADRHGAAAPEVRAVREFLAEVGPQVLAAGAGERRQDEGMPRLAAV